MTKFFMTKKEHYNEIGADTFKYTCIYEIVGSKVSKNWWKSFHHLLFIDCCHFSSVLWATMFVEHLNLFLSQTPSFRIIVSLIPFYLMCHRWKRFNPKWNKMVVSLSKSLNENCLISSVEQLNLIWHTYFAFTK